MKLIVSDASPLIVIAKSGLLPVLTALVQQVVIPETVYAECTVEISLPGARAARAAVETGQIHVRPDAKAPSDDPGDELAGLDAGELAAIHMASALECPVLMDDRLGRQVAKRRGITVIGSAGLSARRQEARPGSRSGADTGSVAAIGLFPVGERGESRARPRRRGMRPSPEPVFLSVYETAGRR